jgi:glycosyltransferase involved in cell wall biosynthesis
MKEPLVSIVVPTYNRRGMLESLLRLIAKQTFPMERLEVVIVDDGSTDGTAELLKQMARELPYRLLAVESGHAGPGAARNLGVGEASAPVIAFLEDDVSPRNDWLANGLRYFDDESVGGVEGVTTQQGRDSSLRSFDPAGFFSFIPCNLFIRRDVFLKSGGYDPMFFDAGTGLYFREDLDLGLRLEAGGIHFVRGEDVIVSHPEQFKEMGDVLRHLRRYVFDALLAKKHRAAYGQRVELKKVAGLVIGRPFHYLSSLYLFVGLPGFVVSIVQGSVPGVLIFLVFLAGLIAGMRIRYRDLSWTLTGSILFCLLPFYYYYWLIRGCLKFRNWNVLL